MIRILIALIALCGCTALTPRKTLSAKEFDEFYYRSFLPAVNSSEPFYEYLGKIDCGYYGILELKEAGYIISTIP